MQIGELSAFISSLTSCQATAECNSRFLNVLKNFGIDTLAAGEVDLNHSERTVFFSIVWPKSWRDFYVGSAFQRHDPVVQSMPNYDGPYSWSDLRNDRRFPLAGTQALAFLASHGWTEGLAVPFPRHGSRYGLVSLVGRRPDFTREEKTLLTLMSIVFFERVRHLAPMCGFPLPPAGLSEREVQSLTLVAKGFSDREVAAELKISTSTATEYFDNVKRKLGTFSRAETAVTAVSLGIIGM